MCLTACLEYRKTEVSVYTTFKTWFNNTPLVGLPRHLREVPSAFAILWEASSRYFIASVAGAIVQGFIPIGIGLIGSYIVDYLVSGQGLSPHLWFLLAGEFLILLVYGLTERFTQLANQGLRHQTQNTLRLKLSEQAARQDLEFFEAPANYDSFARAKREADIRPFIMIMACLTGLQGVVTAIGFLLIVLSFQPLLALVILLSTLPSLIAAQQASVEQVSVHDLTTSDGRYAAYVDDLLTDDVYAKEVRLYGLTELFMSWNRKYTGKVLQKLMQVATNNTFRLARADIVTTVAQYTGIIWVVVAAARGTLSTGEFVLVVGAISSVRVSLQSILGSLGDIYESSLFYASLTSFLTMKPKIVSPPSPKSLPQHLKSGLRFEGVTFAYPGSDKYIFENLSIDFRAGESIAVVGKNGAGKTTLIKLLTRLYDPTAGQILLDGIDIREFEPEEYRKRIAVVLQDFARYQLTASENISFSRASQGVIRSKLVQAAADAEALEFIETLPEKWDTLLGRQFHIRGQNLSGGQWQRIALARALYRNASILIMDEPTAAIDAETEAELFSHFQTLTKDRLSILISHRFNTVKAAQRIIVLEHGRIVEDGSHDALIASQKAYASMFWQQANAYK